MLQVPEAVRFWIDLFAVIGGAISVLCGVAWFVIRNALVTHQALSHALEPMGTQMDDHGDRISKLESDLGHMPDAKAWSDMGQQMVRLQGGIDAISIETRGLRETMERIERPLNVLVDAKLKRSGA